jgi:K+-sensing histidine kinase KdpD
MARGQLRIYLGAAPGVGKTYAMLAEGQRRLARGTDVVGGLIETHGRRLTAAMAEGLEIVRRRTMSYRGTMLTEMDVDAVLARHPQIALVDELAHTNVPGSKNAKRWQDVDELLDAGIDVITTLNIQHLESLSVVARQVTGVEQHERTRSGGRTVILTLQAARSSSSGGQDDAGAADRAGDLGRAAEGPTGLHTPTIGTQTMRKASAGGK